MSKALKVGVPSSSGMGPLINSSALESMENIVEESVGNEGVVACGGAKPNLADSGANGYYFKPTVIEGLDQKSKLFQEEVFGPVIGAIKVSSKEELFKYANDSKYGLASYLFTKDFALAQEASERVRFGELYINMPGPEASQGYHTGFRMTGQAGEGSTYGIMEYLKRKNIYTDYSV